MSDQPTSSESSSETEARSGGSMSRTIGTLLRLVTFGLIVAAIGLMLLLVRYEDDLPSTAELKNYDPPQVTRIMARDGSLLAEMFVERRTVVRIEAIPDVVKQAALAAEDADFYQHEGLDYLGMLRALIVNLRSASKRQGGSTITQQVVKNVLLTPERTFERKARELLLARRIEQELTKDEILELYLNHIYFGHGRYGIEEASRYYFGKSVAALSLSEAATLAGLPKGPGIYSPRVNLERSVKRRNHILTQMAQKNFRSATEVSRAKKTPLLLSAAPESLSELAPEVVSEVRRVLNEYVGSSASRGGYTVRTTIDPSLQAEARKAIRKNLDAYAKRHGLQPPLRRKRRGGLSPFKGAPSTRGHRIYHAVVTGSDDARGELLVRVGNAKGRVRVSRRYNPRGLPPSRFADKGAVLRVSAKPNQDAGNGDTPQRYRLELGPQSALVAIENKSREILAIVGSYEALRGHLDRARFARRQAGSTFKAFVFGYGLHEGRLNPATVVNAEAVSLNPDTVKPLLLREAIARSDNDAAVWALRLLGAEPIRAWSQSLGIQSKLGATESLALGAYELTPLELASAYTTFASGGEYLPARLIRSITGPDGKPVALPRLKLPRRGMSAATAFVMTDMLRSVVQRGTARRARKLGPHVAGKTGTSNRSRDAWFAGYSPETTCVVWTGYDDGHSLGKRESGATAALPAFIHWMKAANKQSKTKAFVVPRGVIRLAIDPASGLRAYPEQEDAVSEWFVTGTEPTETAVDPDEAGAGGAGGAHGAGGAGGAPAAGAGGAPAAGAKNARAATNEASPKDKEPAATETTAPPTPNRQTDGQGGAATPPANPPTP